MKNNTIIGLTIHKLRKQDIIIHININIIINISIMYFLDRYRKMLFPDYYFFDERRLVNHTIEEKRVKNLNECELMCYLND